MRPPRTLQSDIFNDGPVTNFRGGWGVHPFLGRSPRAHFWTQPWQADPGAALVWTRCGKHSAVSLSVPMLGKGTAPQCKHCMKVLKREQREDI